ncbi:MAG: hypothetical protein R3C45_08235 [Phycisphaerales bacterium]
MRASLVLTVIGPDRTAWSSPRRHRRRHDANWLSHAWPVWPGSLPASCASMRPTERIPELIEALNCLRERGLRRRWIHHRHARRSHTPHAHPQPHQPDRPASSAISPMHSPTAA